MRRGHGPRCRVRLRPGHWAVRARVERFGEPALLLLLRERRSHGYELLERLPELTLEGRVDMGNLYRVLRALEEEGIVTSSWDDDAAGPAKRVYALTEAGDRLLDRWSDALREVRAQIDEFLTRYDERREVNI
jgi:PadR family transcriptional regulator PadR